MPRLRRPKNWPRGMEERKLSNGQIAYYWKPSSKDRKAGCTLEAESLGTDYAAAILRCSGDRSKGIEGLNDLLDAWRVGSIKSSDDAVRKKVGAGWAKIGTIDWVIAQFQCHPDYRSLQPNTRKFYDHHLKIIAEHVRSKSKTRYGETDVDCITKREAKSLFLRLQETGPNGTHRVTTAGNAVRAIRRAWNVCADDHHDIMPAKNPFAGVGRGNTGEETSAASFDDLVTFVQSADKLGMPSVGTAAMIAFFWLQRKIDIIGCIQWHHYEKGIRARIIHNKTKQEVNIPLADKDGGQIYPELEQRLARSKKHGTYIIMRDQPDRRRKVHLPYTKDLFEKHAAKVLRHAGLHGSIEFSSFRHGAMTEAGDADATDQQLMALSGHTQRETVSIYTKRTNKQAQQAGTLRRDSRKAGTKNE